MNRTKIVSVFLILGFCFTILGCFSPKSSGIMSAGKDTYTVVVTGTGDMHAMSELMKMAYEEANSFCRQQGKVMQPLSTRQKPRIHASASYYELTFRALYPNDPEYRRPTLESVPDTKIEIQPK